MARQRRGSGIISRAYGSEHDSIIKPPCKARTMEQRRGGSGSTTKNLVRPFLSNATNWEKYRSNHR